MSIMRSCAMVAVAATTLASQAVADERQATTYINPFAAYQIFDNERELSETGTFGVGAEYRFIPNWAVEALFSRADADREGALGSSDFEEIRMDAIYYFAGPEEAWNPYLSAGAGHADFGTDAAAPRTAGSNHDETRFNVGAGVRYNITDIVSLRADLREFHGVEDSTFDTQISLGLSLALVHATPPPPDADNDGVIDSADQCPNTPAGARVDRTGCQLDGDQDGVVDARDACPNTPRDAKVDGRGCELDSDNDGVVNSIDECPNTAAGAKVDAKGCEGITKTIETFEIEVQFPLNSAEIGDAYDDEIRRVADFLKANPETIVEIAGHSDSTGAADYNLNLSQLRAEAVAARLTDALGVNPARVSATGYGETQPIASNDTAEGRATNRRVEARIKVKQ